MKNFDKKIEEYSEELFVDLGLSALSEEKKADIYARLQEHFHKTILNTVAGKVKSGDLEKIQKALDQEDYEALADILRKYAQFQNALDEKIEQEYNGLKLIIAEEQKNAETAESAGNQARGGESRAS